MTTNKKAGPKGSAAPPEGKYSALYESAIATFSKRRKAWLVEQLAMACLDSAIRAERAHAAMDAAEDRADQLQTDLGHLHSAFELLRAEYYAAPKRLGARGGRARSAPLRDLAVSLAKDECTKRITKPSRAAVAKAILPEVLHAATLRGRPLSSDNALRTVDEWLKKQLPATNFASKPGTRSA